MNDSSQSRIEAPEPISDAISLLLLLLIVGDTMFVGIHVASKLVPGIDSELFSLKTDRGYAEFYQYTKLLWAGALLLLIGTFRRSATALCWGLLMLFLLADDALWLHERYGGDLARALGLPSISGMKPEDLGELIYAAGVTAVLALGVMACWVYDRRVWRRLSVCLAVCYGILGAFGMGLDSLDELIPVLGGPFISTLEDVGEMFAVSLMVWVSMVFASGQMPWLAMFERRQ